MFDIVSDHVFPFLRRMGEEGTAHATHKASAAQIEFIDLVIEHLTDQGVMDPSLLYEPPFTGIAPTGPEHLFDEAKVDRLFETIKAINASAIA